MPASDDVLLKLVESGIFDPDHYAAAAGVTGTPAQLFEHYLLHGEPANIAPGVTFDPAYYLARYADITQAGISPLMHYADHGMTEGRFPTAAAARSSAVAFATSDLSARLSRMEERVGHILAQNENILMQLARVDRTAVGPPPPRSSALTDRMPRSLALAVKTLRNPGPVLAELKQVAQDARPYSYRSRRSGQGWRSRLDRKLVRAAVGRHITRKLRGASPVLYKVKQKHPTVSTPRPRILHVIPNVWMGGSTQLIVDLFDHLGHAFDMHVMTSSFPPNGKHEGIVIHDLGEPTSVEAIIDLMGKFKPHLVHVHYWGDVDLPWYEKAFKAARAYGVPVLQNINTPVQPYQDDNIVGTAYVSHYVQKVFGFDRPVGREYVVHPGIDLTRFDDISAMSRDALNSVGMVYRLEGDKLNLSAIDLFIEVVRRRPATRVFIIGGGTFFQPYMDRTIAEGVRDNFVFTGYVPYDELPSYYQKFGTFVAPVWKESFGQVTPFAMNMGRAVAGYDIGALSEILESDATLGSDLNEAATRIVALLENPARIAELGANNRLIAQRKYSIEKMCASYGAIYAQLLGKAEPDLMPGYPNATLFPG